MSSAGPERFSEIERALDKRSIDADSFTLEELLAARDELFLKLQRLDDVVNAKLIASDPKWQARIREATESPDSVITEVLCVENLQDRLNRST